MIKANPQALDASKKLEKPKEGIITIKTQKLSEDEIWATSRLASMSEGKLENILSFKDKEERVILRNFSQIEAKQIEGFGPKGTAIMEDYSPVENGLAIIEDYNSNEVRIIRSSKQFHQPSYRASFLKTVLVNSLELTENKRDELLNDANVELDAIVDRYISDEEKTG